MYDFEWGYEEEQQVKLTEKEIARENELNALCREYGMHRKPDGVYILKYWERYNFLTEPNPFNYYYAEEYRSHLKTYRAEVRKESEFRDKIQKLYEKNKEKIRGKSANYFDF